MKKISHSQLVSMRRKTNISIEKPIQKLNVSCVNCNENYCCINQKSIDVLDVEFDNLEYYIEEKHIERAKKELTRKDGLISCPFNDPKTKQCDIYKDRFVICSLHKVVSPIKNCDSILEPSAETLIVSKKDIAMQLFREPMQYMNYLSLQEKSNDIIDQFKRVYKI